MTKKNIGIQEFLIRHMVFIAFVSFGLLLVIWVFNEYSIFSSESKLLREEYQNSQKAMLRSEVNNVVNYVEYMKAQTERKLKSELKGRVNEAIDIARNIYQVNIDSKSLFEIEKMVKDALRPIRFLEGRGYYFAFSMDGIETLFADRPEMEGKNMLPVQGAKGEYVVRDMIDLVKKQREGFYQYTWTKPFQKEVGFSKIAYVKYFKPLDWAFGTGEYLDDFTNQIQDIVLERVAGLRFSDEGYFFGSLDGGYPLFTNGKITKGTERIWDMTDPDGVKIIQEQQKVSRNTEGGFVQYFWQKLGSPYPVLKISFVRKVPEWGWTIGAGVYLDTIEKIITKNEAKLKKELVKKIITSICVFISVIVLIWFWSKHVAGKTRKSIKMFESSFKNAETESVTIPADDMQFRELSRIAESANRMIDTQKQSEKALRDSEQFLNEIGSIAQIGGWEHDLVTGEAIWTRETYNIVGIESGAIPEPNEHLSYYLPRDREILEKAYRLSVETGEQFDLKLQATTAKGHPLWVRVVGHPKFKDGNCVIMKGIIQNITEQKKMEGQLQQAQKLESIGNLAGGIAHDFNNILSSIIGYTELALDDVQKGSNIEDNLQEVYTAGKRAKDLVKQILAFARQSDEERKPVRVDTIAKEVLTLIRSTIPTTIEVKEKIESRSLIMGNPSQVHQLFMNLCTNAAQAMENTGGILEIRLTDEKHNDSSSTLLGLNAGNYMKITVSDTGSGISPDIIGSIFEPYFTTKGVGEGTGMGLAMVHGLVETYGGEITVDSELGQGTTFSIYLPVTKKSESCRQYEKEALPSGTDRILLVDDELPIVKMGSQVLERLGYRVTIRTSSFEALELFRSKPDDFDLVITDMTMPNMTGDKLAIEMKKIRPEIPVILCTGYSKKVSDETASEIGIKAFAYKPIVKADLAKTVRKVLDEAKG